LRLPHFQDFLIGPKARIGWLLAYLSVLAVAAVIDPPWRSSPASRDVSSLRARAAELADSLFGGEEGSWSVVAEIDTPWGRSIRIRPTVAQIEVRGHDLVVQQTVADRVPIPDGFFFPTGPTSSSDPDDPTIPSETNSSGSGSTAMSLSTDHRASRSRSQDDLDARSAALTGTDVDLSWRCKPIAPIDRERIARLSSITAPAANALARATALSPAAGGFTSPRWIAQPRRDGAWDLWAEGMLDPRAAGMLDPTQTSLSWSTDLPPLDIAIPVQARFDPETGALLEIRDARFLAESVGQALLFDPNPVATSGLSGLRDGSSVDAYRVWVALPRLDGTGKLRGPWVETRSDRPPLANEPALRYEYPSYDPRFEETMAYFHVDRGIERVRERGFDGLFARRIIARVHGTAADNSWYSRPTGELVFGDGGVDDAEDADIILHELGHAIHDALVPGFGDGDTRAISEGFADFWAASLTGEPCVGDWDATSYSPPCLRSAENGAAYPGSLTGRAHADGQIWSGLLWDLRVSLGAATAERLALAAFLEQESNTTWREAAESLLRAATLSADPDEVGRVADALVRRGLLARELAIHLEPGRDWSLHFLAPANFLTHPVGSLHLAGDGTIRFAKPGAPILESAPAVVAAGLSEVENAPPGLALDCAVFTDGGLVTIQQTWRVSTTELAAVRIEWDTVRGALSWTYEQANEGTGAPGLYAGAASVPQSSPVEVDWMEFPSDGLDGIVSCRGSLEEIGAMVGARFTVTPTASSDFSIARTGQPRPAGGGPLLVAFPNPVRESTQVRLFLDHAADAEVGLFDTQGRRVRALSSRRALGSGLTEWSWDGRDDHGRLLPSGRYWARASTPNGATRLPVVLIR
jgi:hypothetical protein